MAKKRRTGEKRLMEPAPMKKEAPKRKNAKKAAKKR